MRVMFLLLTLRAVAFHLLLLRHTQEPQGQSAAAMVGMFWSAFKDI